MYYGLPLLAPVTPIELFPNEPRHNLSLSHNTTKRVIKVEIILPLSISQKNQSPIEKKIRKKFKRLYYHWLTTVCARYGAICSQALVNLSHMCGSQESSLAQKIWGAGFSWTFNVHHAILNKCWFLYLKWVWMLN